MNIDEKYNELRDCLAVGITRMAEIYDSTNKYNNEFETAFSYTINQLKHFDILWEKIRGYH